MTVVRSQESIQEILDKEPEECNRRMKVPIGEVNMSLHAPERESSYRKNERSRMYLIAK